MLYNDQADSMMFNVLDSHDTARIKTLAHDDMELVKQIFAFTFVQPGTPSIYYGTEYGMTGENDPDDRKPMVWDENLQDHDMYQFMQHLINVRKQITNELNVKDLKWNIASDGLIGLNYNDIHAVFNTTQSAVELTIENPLISNLYQNQQLMPKGFILYKD